MSMYSCNVQKMQKWEKLYMSMHSDIMEHLLYFVPMIKGGYKNNIFHNTKQKNLNRTSLVAQWIMRLRLPVQGTWLWSLFQKEIPHAEEPAKPERHNYWSLHAPGPASHKWWAPALPLLKPCAQSLCSARQDTTIRSLCTAARELPGSPQPELWVRQRRPSTAKKINEIQWRVHVR